MERGAGHALGSTTLKSYIEGRRLGLSGKGTVIGVGEGKILVKVRNKDGRVCRLSEAVLVG